MEQKRGENPSFAVWNRCIVKKVKRWSVRSFAVSLYAFLPVQESTEIRMEKAEIKSTSPFAWNMSIFYPTKQAKSAYLY